MAPVLTMNAESLRRWSPGEELQEIFRKWLSPPDPWKNHNIARESQHSGTATWWIHSESFSEWKHSSPSSLLWLHGKRQCLRYYPFPQLMVITFAAGAGKSILWYNNLFMFSLRKLIR